MEFLGDIYAGALILLYLFVTFLVPLALLALLTGAAAYVLAGPEFRLKMVGWAPGVEDGVRRTVRLARALRGRSPGAAE